MRPNEILPTWFRLQRSEHLVDEAEVDRAQKLSKDPVQFFKQVVGFEPTIYQKDFIELFLKNQFLAARWCRQSGKSWIVSALLLWYSLTHPDSYSIVLGPSWRQAKLIIRRITYFLKKIPAGMVLKPQRTMIRFANGSIIEAFPNNPDTVRGPTINGIVYLDEFNFVRDDEELYDAILFTLSTTHGKFVCSSTPWSTDSVFYKIFNHKDYADFARSHVTWEQAVEPHGPLKHSVLEKIRKQFAEDPWRWKREMEAEWAEDETTWLPQSLITKCIDGKLELWPFDSYHQGKFLAGLDLGKHQDYSVLVVIEEASEGKYVLRHWKIFPLGTKYATVIGYAKTLMDRWKTIERLRVDVTGVGEYVVEDMQNAGIEGVEAVTFSIPRKQEIASLLKQRLLEGVFHFPFVELRLSPTVLLSYVAELNVERFQLRKDGAIAYAHPAGQHDDTFWSTGLALYCSVKMTESYVAVLPA